MPEPRSRTSGAGRNPVRVGAVKQDAKNFGYRRWPGSGKSAPRWILCIGIARGAAQVRHLATESRFITQAWRLFYTIYDLRRLKPEQTHLYLLCYAWQRYRQLTDNLVDAFDFHMKQVEDDSKTAAEKALHHELLRPATGNPAVGQLLLLYVDDTVTDATPFGTVRRRQRSRSSRRSAVDARQTHVRTSLSARWRCAGRRWTDWRSACANICGRWMSALDFASATPNPWLAALAWMKQVFARQQPPVATAPRGIPQRHHPQAAATVPPEIRRRRHSHWSARRPLRVLALPPDPEASRNRANCTSTTAFSAVASATNWSRWNEKRTSLRRWIFPGCASQSRLSSTR